MFRQKKETEIVDSIKLKHKLEIAELEKEYELDLKEKEKEYELDLKEREFKLKHFKDEQLTEMQNKTNDLEKEMAVLKKENEMLDKIVDLNADIVDIKSLVSNLIGKLPTMDLKSLTINNGSDK